MGTRELSILKLVDSIKITNGKIEQQFKILEEIRISGGSVHFLHVNSGRC